MYLKVFLLIIIIILISVIIIIRTLLVNLNDMNADPDDVDEVEVLLDALQ